jgi:hypothetical protein
MKTDSEHIAFCVFILHKLARRWRMPVPKAYALLRDSGILDGYLLPNFDVLHTLGAEYLVDDITEFTREKGCAV